ncbi:hypothetical protein [Colwellia sp. 12G3]|uniref:hypothetical protein n=1 Tax=Colwellia sp. 12G3 TaxID=2058299 RepID=UPI000C340055|nr:hypothetical protein [Colwellia sp. 12G3]PKI13054.1 hypothetical protein CXF71_20355 [Colwellia sp. 12G3]
MKKNYHHYALLLSLFIFIIIIYLPGINGALYYDDIRPLSALSKVSDVNSALVYLFSETSGPLGRSVSMLTFLFNAADWPTASSTGDISAFFLFNIILHAINGVLVFGLTYFIALLYRGRQGSNYWLALATSALWLVLPIHVSSSLIAIQRMTGLSALFVFAGLLLYLYGLHKQSLNIKIKNNDGLKLQITGLFIFTLLAMFSKENGILLPIFVLVLELTLLNTVKGIDHRRKLRVYACALGLLIILIYLAYSSFNHNSILQGRDFTLLERVITQPKILLEYISLAFIPDITAFNPYHDNYPHVKNLLDSNNAIVSIVLFFTTLISAITLRHRYPLFSFAVLWFISAHLLESSVINLELYFEHRNYVALFGPCLALVFVFMKIPKHYKKLSVVLFSIYWLYLVFNLSMTTQLWGDPFNASRAWFIEQKGSQRAAADLAYKYFNRQEPKSAWQVIEKQVEDCTDCIHSRAQALLFSCFAKEDKRTNVHYQKLLTLAHTARKANAVAPILAQVHKLINDKVCTSLTVEDVKKLNTELLHLPDSAYNKKSPYIQNLYSIALNERNREEAIRLLYLAWNDQQDQLIANELVAMLLAAKRYDEANDFVNNRICKTLPLNPILANIELQQCLVLFERVTNTLKSNLKH